MITKIINLVVATSSIFFSVSVFSISHLDAHKDVVGHPESGLKSDMDKTHHAKTIHECLEFLLRHQVSFPDSLRAVPSNEYFEISKDDNLIRIYKDKLTSRKKKYKTVFERVLLSPVELDSKGTVVKEAMYEMRSKRKEVGSDEDEKPLNPFSSYVSQVLNESLRSALRLSEGSAVKQPYEKVKTKLSWFRSKATSFSKDVRESCPGEAIGNVDFQPLIRIVQMMNLELVVPK